MGAVLGSAAAGCTLVGAVYRCRRRCRKRAARKKEEGEGGGEGELEGVDDHLEEPILPPRPGRGRRSSSSEDDEWSLDTPIYENWRGREKSFRGKVRKGGVGKFEERIYDTPCSSEVGVRVGPSAGTRSQVAHPPVVRSPMVVLSVGDVVKGGNVGKMVV